jgi:NAD-dependent DNA ligase
MLKASLRYHKYLYYELDRPELTDKEYDILEKRFDKLAERINLEGSWVGYNKFK